MMIEKIISRLEELKAKEYNDSDEEPEYCDPEEIYDEGRSQGRYEGFHETIQIVQEVAQEFGDGWIPCNGCSDCKHKECEHYGKF